MLSAVHKDNLSYSRVATHSGKQGKSGNFKKSYLCKVKILKFYRCSDVATGGFFSAICLKYLQI